MLKRENPARPVDRSYRTQLLHLERDPTPQGLFDAGEAARRIGEYRRAECLFKRSLLAARAARDASAFSWGLWGIATIRRITGDFSSALACYERAAACAIENDNPNSRNWALAGRAEIVRHQRNHTAALQAHEQLLIAFQECGDTVGTAWALQGIGQIYLVNSMPAANDLFHRADELALKLGDLRAQGFSRRALAMSARQQGDIPRARTLLREARQIFERLEYHVGIGFVQREQAHCDIIDGHVHQAQQIILCALAHFGKHFPLGRAWALATLADVQQRTHPDNERIRLQSAELFKALGVRIDLSTPQATYQRKIFATHRGDAA